MDETADVTLDHVLGGRVILSQPARGYRAGLDAAMLAAACDARPGERVVEPGCGVGAALLAAAVRRPGAAFTGVERDLRMLALAGANVAANGLEARVAVEAGDVGAFSPRLGARFDAAICNPPYFDDPAKLRPPRPDRRGAYMADAGLEAWTGWLLAAVRDGGTVVMIHRAERLADLIALLGAKAGSLQIRPLHSFADAPAGRVVVRAVRGGRAPLRLLAPIFLHTREGGRHTPEAEAILRGEADLAWL